MSADAIRILIDVVVLTFIAEIGWLKFKRPQLLFSLMPNLLSGLSLAVSLRVAVSDAASLWIPILLMLAGAFHVCDWIRCRPTRGQRATDANSMTNATGP